MTFSSRLIKVRYFVICQDLNVVKKRKMEMSEFFSAKCSAEKSIYMVVSKVL